MRCVKCAVKCVSCDGDSCVKCDVGYGLSRDGKGCVLCWGEMFYERGESNCRSCGVIEHC